MASSFASPDPRPPSAGDGAERSPTNGSRAPRVSPDGELLRRILESAARLSQGAAADESPEWATLREAYRRRRGESPSESQLAEDFVRASLPAAACALARRAGLEQVMITWIAEQLLDAPEAARRLRDIWRRLEES